MKVQSKIEYIIYRTLQEARNAGRLSFEYEPKIELPIDGRRITVKPDFVIQVRGKTFYWEHLGMLDRQDYGSLWRSRRASYETEGLSDVLVTTDDLNGVRHERLMQVLGDLLAIRPAGDAGDFSRHHYSL